MYGVFVFILDIYVLIMTARGFQRLLEVVGQVGGGCNTHIRYQCMYEGLYASPPQGGTEIKRQLHVLEVGHANVFGVFEERHDDFNKGVVMICL